MKKRLFAILAVLLGCVLLSGNITAFALPAPDLEIGEDGFETGALQITAPEGEVTFHTQLQQDALEAGAEHISEFSKNGQEELSIPEGIWFTWTCPDPQPETFFLSLAASEDLSDAVTYEIPSETGDGEYSYNVQNLLLDTVYYYTIAADDIVSDVYSFTTSGVGPRNLYVDGVTNIRDLGGWPTADGGKIRQGLLFRCGELNAAGTQDPCITPEGIAVMRDDLQIRTEIDLRRTEDDENGHLTESVLGSDVQYFSNPIGYITDVTPDLESIAETFRIMADENNYPMIYHCKIGTDRTGLISYLLLALCGVQMDDIYIDYAFSNLGHIEGKRNPNRLDKMVEDNLADFAGETPRETAVNFLKSIGLTDEELDSIVAILVEK